MASTIEDLASNIWLDQLREKIAYISLMVVLPFGFITNIISIFVFLRKKFMLETMGFYNIINSIINCVTIIFVVLDFFIKNITNDLSSLSDFNCKSITFGLRLFVQVISWLNVFITVDRMISITYPGRFLILKDKVKLLYIILFMICFLAAINTPNLLYYVDQISTNGSNGTVNIYCTATKKVNLARDIIALLFRFFFPIMLTIFFNSFLIYKLISVRKKFRTRSSLRREYVFSFSIMAMNCLFILALAPQLIVLIYVNTIQYEIAALRYSKKVVVALFYLSSTALLTTFNFCFNMVVNLVFNKLFRREFICFVKEIIFFYKENSKGNQSSTNA